VRKYVQEITKEHGTISEKEKIDRQIAAYQINRRSSREVSEYVMQFQLIMLRGLLKMGEN